MDNELSYHELMEQGKEAESGGNSSDAVKRYLQAIKRLPNQELPYKRLMILYRKEKDYKKELGVIDKALRFFGNLHTRKKTSIKINRQLSTKSRQLAKSLGLTDAKGNNLHLPEPLAGWERRKALVQKS